MVLQPLKINTEIKGKNGPGAGFMFLIKEKKGQPGSEERLGG
jgi:hypothetical protein